jgi:hypothetical protein
MTGEKTERESDEELQEPDLLIPVTDTLGDRVTVSLIQPEPDIPTDDPEG